MGRKKILKLQRKEERVKEVINKKESRKKTIISIVFLVVFAFAAYQINIAMNKNNENNNVSVNDITNEDENKKDDNINNVDNANDINNADAENDSEQNEELIEPADDLENDPADIHDYGANKIVMIETNKGNIKLELFTNDAPKTVENFVKLASEDFYNEIKFHRVISDFMIQGGDPLSKDDDPSDDGTGGPGYSFEDEMNPINLGLDEMTIQRYEASGYKYNYNLNSHKMEVGVLAMANSGPNTNGSQFFIVTESPQPHLDGKHTVFGKVIEGMEVVKSIEQGDVMERVYVVE